MQREASPGQHFKRAAGAPVEGKEATRLARCRSGNLSLFHDNDIDAATTEEIGGTGADHTPPQITTRMISPKEAQSS